VTTSKAAPTVEDTTEDDEDAVANGNSTQIGDPRPCWMRDTTDDATDNPTLQTDPWAMAAPFNIATATGGDWSGDTTIASTRRLGWFNRTWRDTGAANTSIASGDNWFKVYATGTAVVPTYTDSPDNLLYSFPPETAEVECYNGMSAKQVKVMNIGLLPTPGYIGFVHAGVPWCTVALTSAVDPDGLPNNIDPGRIGAADLVYLRNFTNYLMGPVSPYENAQDDDADGTTDDDGTAGDDRLGPEIRCRGKINVNMAPADTLRAVFDYDWLDAMWGIAPDTCAGLLAGAIVDHSYVSHGGERGPYTSVDDFMNRTPEIFEMNPAGGANDNTLPNSFRREALARFMYNMVTVRTAYDPARIVLRREMTY